MVNIMWGYKKAWYNFPITNSKSDVGLQKTWSGFPITNGKYVVKLQKSVVNVLRCNW